MILLLAVVNLLLVLFDYTYLDLRHHYQAFGWQEVVTRYDLVKGIEPHRETDAYGRSAEATFRMLREAPSSPETRSQLARMRSLSRRMLDQDPFLSSGLRGVSEQLKAKFRQHAWQDTASPQELVRWADRLSLVRFEAALKIRPRPWDHYSVSSAMMGGNANKRGGEVRILPGFWSEGNLAPARLEAEQAWFEREIAPLLARNYWQTYGEDGEPADHFWLIDCLFLPIFVAEFLIRGAIGVRRGVYQTFTLFTAARWYDVIYVLPLVMYALPPSLQGPLHAIRIISVSARMERLGLINPVAILKPYLTKPLDTVADLVNVKLLSSYQTSIQNFSVQQALDSLTPAQRQEVARLIESNVALVIQKVLPDVRPGLEELMARAAQDALEESPAYLQLRQVPVLGSLPDALLKRIITESLAQMHGTMLRAISDPENVSLTKGLISALSASLLRHMGEIGTEHQVKAMLVDMLEEQKRKLLLG
ncbi:MAG: hypothetical protein VKP62_05600 [Candidatus Sericytochromatia bacterium]|nr:hypothetical protein [Candidatus Sericytochromatia bacterium]